MKKIKFHLRLTVYILILFSTSNLVHSRSLDKHYDSLNLYNYFSGVVSLYDNEYASSYKYLRKLEGLEEHHYAYSKFYQYSLVNSGRIYEAYRYSKKLEKKGKGNFEGKLIIGIYYLKNKKYEKAIKYFGNLKSKNNQQDETIQNLVSISLENWLLFLDSEKNEAVNLMEKIPSRYKSIKKIQNAFLHCFFESNSTDKIFSELVSNKETDFSRYSFFHANYLNSLDKKEKAIDTLDLSLKLIPRNLILNQLKIDLNNKKVSNFSNRFDCKNLSHISAEILYIVSNALSAQSAYGLSNFYLNLAKYLNPHFISFDTLYAENFYLMKKFESAKEIYKKIINAGSIYKWYASKEISSILLEQDKKIESVKFLKQSYEKIISPNVAETFDYAKFLKNNEEYYESIKQYTKVLNLIDKDHYLYPKATDGRGVSYERTDQWEKAEKDFLNSLSVSPDQAYVINYLAYSWIEKGINVKKSLRMLKKANDLKSNDGYIIDSLGWALFKLKKYKEAERYLRLAVMLMPSDPIANDHYGDALWMIKETMQARYHWSYVFNSKEADEKLKKSAKEKSIFGLQLKDNINKS